MRIWPALLLAPALALADQVIAFAVIGWACARGQPAAVHAVHVAFFVAAVATLPSAWREWKETRMPHAAAGERAVLVDRTGDRSRSAHGKICVRHDAGHACFVRSICCAQFSRSEGFS